MKMHFQCWLNLVDEEAETSNRRWCPPVAVVPIPICTGGASRTGPVKATVCFRCKHRCHLKTMTTKVSSKLKTQKQQANAFFHLLPLPVFWTWFQDHILWTDWSFNSRVSSNVWSKARLSFFSVFVVAAYAIMIFYWSLADYQLYVNFRYTAKWFNYTYACVCSFKNSFPIQAVGEYWAESPLLHSRTCWLSVLNIALHLLFGAVVLFSGSTYLFKIPCL